MNGGYVGEGYILVQGNMAESRIGESERICMRGQQQVAFLVHQRITERMFGSEDR